MSEKLALIELYEAAKRFEPVLRQHEAILLKVIFEVDGRNVIFNYDPKEVFLNLSGKCWCLLLHRRLQSKLQFRSFL
jgi:hypothetical protein